MMQGGFMNKLVRGAAVTVVAVASLTTSRAAFAATHDNVCDVAESCAFKDYNYAGGMSDGSSTDSDWRNDYFSSGGSAHDAASSGFGNTRAEQYWAGINFAGEYFILGANQYDARWSTS